ncbi:hypothetical protein LXL04_020935 [Taraxacum kok-saghyz]
MQVEPTGITTIHYNCHPSKLQVSRTNTLSIAIAISKSTTSHYDQGNMPRVYSNIMDITPTSEQNWTVLIQVLEVGHKQQDKDQQNYRRLLFIDAQGTTVPAIIFSYHLKHFEGVFVPYRKYSILNAKLVWTDPRVIVGSYTHTWSLTKQTLVETHTNEVSPLTCKFEIAVLHHLINCTNLQKQTSIKGSRNQVFSEPANKSRATSSKKDVIIVNDELVLITYSLINHYSNCITIQSIQHEKTIGLNIVGCI